MCDRIGLKLRIELNQLEEDQELFWYYEETDIGYLYRKRYIEQLAKVLDEIKETEIKFRRIYSMHK